MKIRHEKPVDWVDTSEQGVIQPSHVAGLEHVIEIEPGDFVQGPQGVKGDTGAVGPQGAGAAWPAGAVMYFAMLDVPPGWLACDGTYYQQADYPALCSAIGSAYGGDGVSGFCVPDLRGEFLRCLDTGRGVDAYRQIGSTQEDCNRAHWHEYKNVAVNGVEIPYSGEGWYSRYFDVAVGSGVDTTSLSGNGEARPRNIAMLACISTGK